MIKVALSTLADWAVVCFPDTVSGERHAVYHFPFGKMSLAKRHLGCPAGLEPAISGVTILRLDQLDYGQHLEARTGIEPVFAVLQTVAYSSIDNRAILKS